VASIGYFLRKPLVVIQNNLYILVVGLLGLSLFATFPDEMIFGLIGLLLSQSITVTGFFQLALEDQISFGILKFLKVFPKAAVAYQSLIYGSFSTGVDMSNFNAADYVITGRRPGIEHFSPFKAMAAIKDKLNEGDIYQYLDHKNFQTYRQTYQNIV